MPTPRKGESREAFISRCVGYVREHEGITDSSHAAAKCNGIWEQHQKKSKNECPT